MTALLSFGITGCGASGTTAVTGSFPGPRLSGHAHGGQQPVVGASIQLYAVGTEGLGSAARPLLSAPVLTDSAGVFAIPDYTCPSAQAQTYLVATGGNPGLPQAATNADLSMMAALGSCSSLDSVSFVNINEITTVAVWALAPFMSSATQVGTDAAHLPALLDAFFLASEFVDVVNGSAPGPGLPQGSAVPVAKINTLGDMLSSCINTYGGAAGTTTPCGQLFSLMTVSPAPAPADVVPAALHIAQQPTAHVASLYNLIPAVVPFEPVLTSAPTGWTLTVQSPLAPPPSSYPGVDL